MGLLNAQVSWKVRSSMGISVSVTNLQLRSMWVVPVVASNGNRLRSRSYHVKRRPGDKEGSSLSDGLQQLTHLLPPHMGRSLNEALSS